MMRILGIVVSLLVGLVGLFMSVCGGGLLLSMGFATLRNIFGPTHDPGAAGALFILLVPAGSLALGILVCRKAYQILQKQSKRE
jgi:hypothetical protein